MEKGQTLENQRERLNPNNAYVDDAKHAQLSWHLLGYTSERFALMKSLFEVPVLC